MSTESSGTIKPSKFIDLFSFFTIIKGYTFFQRTLNDSADIFLSASIVFEKKSKLFLSRFRRNIFLKFDWDQLFLSVFISYNSYRILLKVFRYRQPPKTPDSIIPSLQKQLCKFSFFFSICLNFFWWKKATGKRRKIVHLYVFVLYVFGYKSCNCSIYFE